ncbi:MAG: cation-transporting P-type ATPase [Gammaproteobacteria bacterium]|nr:cation-transporting P-type ATPase [Gammaproteobacteria bacterium]
MPTNYWHALDLATTLSQLDSESAGLGAAEAARRLAAHGPNRLTPPPRRGPLRRFLLQFHNVLIYVLLAAAGVTLALGHGVDTGVILGVVIINALIGFLQEGKAEKSIDAIRRMLSLRAVVLRDRKRQEIDASGLVPGDVVLLASGDKVPADLRLIETRTLRVEEAALTGESEPVEKSVAAVAADAPVGDRTGMAYSGTFVVFGQGRGVVVATGDATELGRIGRMLSEVATVETPLTKQIARFGAWLTAGILLLGALTVAFGMLVHDEPAAGMFLAAVGLAVAAVPEGLPAIMTITLAIGVQRMAGRNAIIRRMPAVETLGAVTVICTDKTGTLTQNEMTVQRLATTERLVEVAGVGYAPHGGFACEGRTVETAELAPLAQAALLCNDAVLRETDGEWTIEGDPTEGALLAFAHKAGLGPHAASWPRVSVIPFESEHRFMATLHRDPQGATRVFVKGAPERVLGMCSMQRTRAGDAPLDAALWHARAEAFAAEGFRVLALATTGFDEEGRELDFADVERGLTLLGLAAIMDPPRPEAVRAVAACRAAGIRVKMITGDHAVTAEAIARAVGLTDAGARVLTGADIETLAAAGLQEAVREAAVFARASPAHKLRLVEALQANGEVVAMTGDGVNDAPALKRADVGVAMGEKGTEAAKEAAEMVLADDNFASIAAAVEEGRTVYDNLRKAIVYVLPTSIGQASMVLIAVLLGMTLPITPVQILWINMVTAVTLSLAIAFERPEPGLMARPPRDPREPLVNGFMLWRIGFVTALLAASSFGMFLWEIERGMSLEFARTAAVNTLVMGQIVYLFNCRRLTDSVLSREGLFGNRIALVATAALVALQLAMTHLPLKQMLFGTADLDAQTWLRVLVAGVVLLFVVEAEKSFWRSRAAA